MTIEAKIICDSVAPHGSRLTTFQLRYPRMIHAELMTHRMFSRNASSSRAIPVKKMIEDVLRDPALPVYWGKNQPGMQAAEELTGEALERVQRQWLAARDAAVFHVQNMLGDDLHKQIANRVLEPWMHISVVLTATDEGLANWFWLRKHADAQPEIRALADAMWRVYQESQPRMLDLADWHLPYLRGEDVDAWSVDPALAGANLTKLGCEVSAARCCRVSYLKHDGTTATLGEELALVDRLIGAEPLHASPFEHQATPDVLLDHDEDGRPVWANPELHGNLPGWIQFRKVLPNEAMFDITRIQ